MHVTVSLAKQEVDVEVGEDCRTIQALKESVVAALPQLRVEGFDVSVGGRALDDDGVVSLTENACLDVSANSRGLSVLALREAGHKISEAGLLKAAAGDVALCTLYLDAGVPIDCVDRRGQTPLHLSCRCKTSAAYSLATLLLDRGSRAIDEKTGEGSTPLHISCSRRNFALTTLLLDRGSRAIDEKDGEGSTPLHISCSSDNLALATLLLNRGSRAIDEKNGNGDTPLHLVCGGDDLTLVTLLLDRGSRAIDEKDREGDTPLHLSCTYGDLALATLLLDRGSRAIDEKNGRGDTPLHISCTPGNLKLVTLLLDRGSRAIDEKNGDGDTPLHISCRAGNLKLVTLLLDRGCGFDVEEYDRSTPYSEEVLKLLFERGHDVAAAPGNPKRRRIGEHS